MCEVCMFDDVWQLSLLSCDVVRAVVVVSYILIHGDGEIKLEKFCCITVIDVVYCYSTLFSPICVVSWVLAGVLIDWVEVDIPLAH